MLNLIGSHLQDIWGPARLLTSYFTLATLGLFSSMVFTVIMLPVLWNILPVDRGRAHAFGADKSVGKPLSAGVIITGAFAISVLIFAPFKADVLLLLPILFIVSAYGFIDDKTGGLSEYTLGAADFAVSLLAAIVLAAHEPNGVWVPFAKGEIPVPHWVDVAIITTIIWLSINSLNCNDGVDGLSASLSITCLIFLVGLLYIVIGNQRIAEYLLVPYNANAAIWALVGVLMIGCLSGYLWHNAPPSSVLMGDSGSRPVGFLIGILVSVALNPFLLLVCGSVILANGATGLVKVVLLRFFKIAVFRNVRFPLHDHARINLKWTDAQVLVRFVLLQSAVTSLLLAFLLKLR